MTITEIPAELQLLVNFICFIIGSIVGALFGGHRNGKRE
jgi:hypothetical protein